MEIWLDTSDSEIVRRGFEFGISTGVTTNPSILSKDLRPLDEILNSLLQIQPGWVAVQVLASDAAEMVEQGRNLSDFSDRLIVKIPVTPEGLKAIHTLSSEEIPTLGTVVYHPSQALLAAEAGADYIAPYIGWIEKSGEDPWKFLQQMKQFIQNYDYSTRILGASLSSVGQILKCAEMGIEAVTLKPELFETLVAVNPAVQNRIEQFENDWNNQKEKKSLSLK